MKELLLRQLKTLTHESGWFVPFGTATGDLNEELASRKSNAESNSISEIVHHLNYWNSLYLNRFRDPSFRFEEVDNDTTFQNVDGLSWEETIRKAEALFDAWHEAIEKADEEKLQSRDKAGRIWGGVLSDIFLHNTYHFGQIVTIRKEYKIWDKEKGVK